MGKPYPSSSNVFLLFRCVLFPFQVSPLSRLKSLCTTFCFVQGIIMSMNGIFVGNIRKCAKLDLPSKVKDAKSIIK